MSTRIDFPSFLSLSPFGPYCNECSVPLAIEKGIYNHAKASHPAVSFKNALLVGTVKTQMAEMRSSHFRDLSPFLLPESSPKEMWFCIGCFVAFGKHANYKRHFESRCNRDCVTIHDKKALCYATICGRFGPKWCMPAVSVPLPSIVTDRTSVSSLSQSRSHQGPSYTTTMGEDHASKSATVVPPALMTTLEDAMEILKPFVRPDEDVKDLCLIYYPLLSPDFEGTMREYIQFSSKQVDEDPILIKWIEAGKSWLTNYASGHIANVSANVRHRLAEFEQQEVDGTTYGTRTFVLRRGIPHLVRQLEAALRFFYRYPTCLFNEFKNDEVKNSDEKWMIENAIIPKILYTAAKEEPTNHGQLPVTCRYCLSRGFSIKNQTQLVMNECGWFSSHISAVLHLLRAGVCGYLVTLSVQPGSQVLSLEELEVVRSIQNGRVTNLLAPYVKRLRDLNDRKPPAKNNTVNSNGDITSGAFTFPKSIWSTIIPRLTYMAKSCFEEIFIGTEWRHFLSLPISVADWIQLDVSVMMHGSCIPLKNVQVNEQVDNLLAQLQAIAELCLFGLGVGAVRHEELTRLKAISFQWHNSYLYYWTESLKLGSLKGSTKKPRLVEHRLSLTISRIFLLLRYAFVATGRIGYGEVMPCLPEASMLSLIRDLFDFDCLPHMLNVRHLFTSLGNILLPESNDRDDGAIVSNVSMTEKSGHTQGTGRRAYGTYLENSDELLYDTFHTALGEVSLDPPTLSFTPYTDSVLLAALKELFGRQATFRSVEQKNMVDIASNCLVRHSFVGIPCGQGKSLSWLVPTMASYLSGRKIGLRIVVVPYKFLLGHMVEQATLFIGMLRERIRIEVLYSVEPESIASILDEKNLPAILFLNLDSASTLLRYHMGYLQKLASSRLLHRIYIDEFQQMVIEFGFRSAYHSLRDLGRIGVPVMCLSGSMPLTIAKSLMSYCRLSVVHQVDDIEIVRGCDPLGDGFFFDVKIVQDVGASIVESVLMNMDSACHVICDTKVLLGRVLTLLANRRSVLVVTGDSPSHEQFKCAKDWASGTHDVLVSTIVALVGNENKRCKKIVVGGFLYNVSSLVQAIGRLRPDQRGPGARVEVFRLPFSTKVKENAKQTEQNSFDELRSASCLEDDCFCDYSKVFSPIGLQKILVMKTGCFLQSLSSYYGFARPPCLHCGLCMQSTIQPCPDSQGSTILKRMKRVPSPQLSSSPDSKRGRNDVESNVRIAKEYAVEANQEEKRIRRLADSVFRELLYRCISCGSSTCIGECGRGCYRCGDRLHHTNACSYTFKKLSLILSNKGVCFGCFDTRQRGIEHHTMKDCPMRRRLKRLLFLDRERRKMHFEPYLRLIYTDELSFIRVVATFSDEATLGRKEKRVLACEQESHDSDSAPLLPPNKIHLSKDISVEGKPRSTTFSCVSHARSEYKKLLLEKSSCRRRRKFVFGAIHEKLFPGFHEVNPLIRDFDLVVKLDDGASTTIQIRRISPDEGVDKDKLLNEGVLLGRTLSGTGNARGAKVGDLGAMHAIGYRCASTKEVYVTSKETADQVKVVSSLMREWMEDNMSSVLKNLLEVDASLNISNSLACMPVGPGSRMMVSINLANAAHLDVNDTSLSVALWLEEKPGQSTNWYFVLPNLSHNGSDGVVVRLYHGVVISWDAKSIFHCTTKTNVGPDNRVYGCMWGSSKP